MKRDPSDPQKHLVYRWEDRWRCFNERTLTREQARRCVARVARKWHVEPPTVLFLVRGVREWSYVQGDLLALNYDQCNEAMVAHEMAHYVTDKSYAAPVHSHGPEFVAVYIAMLEFLEVAPRVALEASLKAEGVQWRTD